MLNIQSLVVAAVLSVAGSTIAQDVDQSTDQVAQRQAELHLKKTNELRCAAASIEFEKRFAEFTAGRSSANTVIQSNQRWLDAALDCGQPNAAITYNHRAIKIAQFARMSLEAGTGTQNELEQAKQATLNAMLKRMLQTQL